MAIEPSAHDVVRLVAAKDVSESRTTGTSSSFLSTTVYDHGSIDEILRFATLEARSGGLTIASGARRAKDMDRRRGRCHHRSATGRSEYRLRR